MATTPGDILSGFRVNNERSGNRTEGHPLLRMKLTWKEEEYRFAVNPEDYTQSEPNKATITQTKGGAWIDAWGEGIKELTIKGTTGMYAHKGRDGSQNPDAGYQRWKNLRNLIQHVYDSVKDGEEVEPMRFYNYTDNEYFYVYPAQGGIELYRSKARPNLYQYTLRFWCLRRLGEPEKERQVQGDPGRGARELRAKEKEQLEELLDKYKGGSDDVDLSALVQFVEHHPRLKLEEEDTGSEDTGDENTGSEDTGDENTGSEEVG